MSSFRKKARRTWKKFRKKAKPFLVNAVRAAARGLYFGVRGAVRAVSSMPSRALLVFGSVVGFVFVTIIVLSIALPSSKTNADYANMAARALEESAAELLVN